MLFNWFRLQLPLFPEDRFCCNDVNCVLVAQRWRSVIRCCEQDTGILLCEKWKGMSWQNWVAVNFLKMSAPCNQLYLTPLSLLLIPICKET
jgi:hypothetical protein